MSNAKKPKKEDEAPKELGDFISSFSKFMAAEKEKVPVFPCEVSGVDWKLQIGVSSKSWNMTHDSKPGSFVMIRSCKEGHGDKTRLGLLIGYVAIHEGLRYDKATRRLEVSVLGDNPAIFVFDLCEVVLGCESFWGPIESESQLREITDGDIQNIWYIKALKALSQKESAKEPKKGDSV